MRHLLLLPVLLLMVAHASGQYSRIVGVTGTTLTGTSFTLQIDASPSYLRSIDFVNLPTEYPPLAMAQLLAANIEDDYFSNGKTGFRAGKVKSVEGGEFDATFEIRCTAPITQIKVGMLGNPNVPLPRAPGVAFNPNIVNYDGNLPTPLLGPQPSHPNATFTVNGEDPSSDFFRRRRVLTNTVMNWRVSTGTNPNQWVTLLGGPYNPGILTSNWGEYLDLGLLPYVNGLPSGLFVIGDGIFQSSGSFFDPFFRSDVNGNFDFAITVPANLAGANVGLQALVQDPTAVFPFFRFTNAVDVSFDDGQDFSVQPPADGVVPVNLTSGRTFDFYGATYSNLFVHENGVISFGTPGPTGAQIDPSIALAGAPSVLVNWADWDLSGSVIRVREFQNRLVVSWGSPTMPARHFGDTDLAWFSAQLALDRPLIIDESAGSILLDFENLDPAATGGNDAVVGTNPGMNLDPAALALDLGARPFGAASGSALLHQSNRGGAALGSLNVASGGSALYSNGSGLSLRDIGFFPARVGTGPLSNRPFAISSSPNPDDLQGIFGTNTISITGGVGQQLILIGYFKNLFTAQGSVTTQVILDPNGQAGVGPIPLQIDALITSEPPGGVVATAPLQPGFRDNEGLIVSLQTPLVPGNAGLVDLAVTFGDGQVMTLSGAVLIQP